LHQPRYKSLLILPLVAPQPQQTQPNPFGWLLARPNTPLNPADPALNDSFLRLLSQQIAQRYHHLQTQTALHQQQTLAHCLTSLQATNDLTSLFNTLINLAPQLGTAWAGLFLREDVGTEHLHHSPALTQASTLLQNALAIAQKHQLNAKNPLHHLPNWPPNSPWLALETYQPLPKGLVAISLNLDYGRAEGLLLYGLQAENTAPQLDYPFWQSFQQSTRQILKNSLRIDDARVSAKETRLLLDTARELAAANNFDDVRKTAVQAVINAGAKRCSMFEFIGFTQNQAPQQAELVAVRHNQRTATQTDWPEGTFNLADYPTFTHNTLGGQLHLIEPQNPAYTPTEQAIISRYQLENALLLPLSVGQKPLGYLLAEYPASHTLSDRELSTMLTLANRVGAALQSVQGLMQTQQRARQLETGAEISKVSTRNLNQAAIVNNAVQLIQQGFEFYYVGLFFVEADDSAAQPATSKPKWAVLQAGTGEAGRQQLSAGHRLPVDDNSMVGWCIQHQQARIALDVTQDNIHHSNPYLPDTRSEMALPLLVQGQTIGALSIQSTNPKAFNQEDVAALQIMADQLANAIQNARLYSQMQQNASEIQTLLEITQEISANVELKDVLKAIVKNAIHLIQGDQGTIFLLNEEDLLIPQVQVGNTNEILALRLKLGEGLTGQVAQQRRALVRHVDDPSQVPQVPGTQPIQETVVGVPIQTEQELIGVLLIRRQGVEAKFTPADVERLESLSLQAALAVRNARLLNETQLARQETEALYQLGRELSTIETMAEAARAVVQYANKTHFDRHLIALKQNPPGAEAPWVELIAAWDKSGLGPNLIGRRYTSQQMPLVQQMLENNRLSQYLAINNVAEDDFLDAKSRQIFLNQGVKSVLIVPIRTSQKFMGWFLSETLHHPLNLQQSTLITPILAIVDQLNLTLDRLEKTESLIEAGQQYLAIVDNIPGAVYRSRGRKADRLIYVSDDIASITGYAPEDFSATEGLTLRSLIHPEDQAWVLEKIETQLENHQAYGLEYRILTKTGQIRYVSERGRAVRDTADRFMHLDGVFFDVTERVHLQAAMQKRASQFEAVAKVGQSASAILNVDRLLGEVVELISDSFGFYYAAIFLLDEAAHWAILQAASGPAGQRILAQGHRLKRDIDSMVGRAIYFGKAQITLEATNEKQRFNHPELPHTRSEIALPLTSQGQVIGALDVQSEDLNAFTEDDIATFQLMANQLANAIANARLLADTEKSLERANLLYQTTEKLLEAKNEADLFQRFVQATAPLPLDSVSICIRIPTEPPSQDDDIFFEMAAVQVNHGQPVLPLGARFSLSDILKLPDLSLLERTLTIDNIVGNPLLTESMRQRLMLQNFQIVTVVPILMKGQLEGAVIFTVRQIGRTMTAKDERLYESLVQQLAITRQNLELLDSMERRLRRERIIREVTEKIHAANGVEGVLNTTLSELGQALNASQGVARLKLE
jgi:PAS domain S-box-containing protein